MARTIPFQMSNITTEEHVVRQSDPRENWPNEIFTFKVRDASGRSATTPCTRYSCSCDFETVAKLAQTFSKGLHTIIRSRSKMCLHTVANGLMGEKNKVVFITLERDRDGNRIDYQTERSNSNSAQGNATINQLSSNSPRSSHESLPTPTACSSDGSESALASSARRQDRDPRLQKGLRMDPDNEEELQMFNNPTGEDVESYSVARQSGPRENWPNEIFTFKVRDAPGRRARTPCTRDSCSCNHETVAKLVQTFCKGLHTIVRSRSKMCLHTVTNELMIEENKALFTMLEYGSDGNRIDYQTERSNSNSAQGNATINQLSSNSPRSSHESLPTPGTPTTCSSDGSESALASSGQRQDRDPRIQIELWMNPDNYQEPPDDDDNDDDIFNEENGRGTDPPESLHERSPQAGANESNSRITINSSLELDNLTSNTSPNANLESRRPQIAVTDTVPVAIDNPLSDHPQLGRGKKADRLKPGVRALKKISRVDLVSDTKALDPDFVPPTKISKPAPDEEVVKRKTRGSTRTFFNFANNLEILPSGHTLDDEAKQYREFVGALESACQKKPTRSGFFFETEHAVWLSMIVRYDSMVTKSYVVSSNEEKHFWSECNGYPSTIAKEIMHIFKTSNKPVCALVGQEQHCTVVILIPNSEGWRAIVKDALPIKETTVQTLAFKLLCQLNVDFVELTCELEEEKEVTNTECIRECYKVVGDVLDGKFFWKRDVRAYTKKFNVETAEEVKK